MQAELKLKWVTALRSGEYKQGTGYLKAKNQQGEIQYCCLGVLCEITGIEFGSFAGVWMNNVMAAYPIVGTEYLGMPDIATLESWGFAGERVPSTLARMNDDGKTFTEIADYIEQHV